MDRQVAHLDVDDFFVACERLMNSKLQGLPVIIGGGKERGLVAACSDEAKHYGVRRMMPMQMALQLCPNARVLRADMDLYSKQSQLITDIISEHAPVTEKAGINEFYLDLSGMDRFFGCLKWAEELMQRVKRESGLQTDFALSVNKTVSRIANDEHRTEVKEQEVRSFLNPLSIQKIPLVGAETYQLLSRIGIRRIQTLSETPVDLLQELLGKNGKEIWKRSNGIDTEPVEPYNERKSISAEYTFETDTIDIALVKRELAALVEKLCYQLRQEAWLTSVISVRIRYTNFDTQYKQCRVPYTSCDHAVLQPVQQLFEKSFDRRMRLRLVGLKFSGLIRGAQQINLFEDSTTQAALYQAIDRLKNRYGFTAVMRSVGLSAVKGKEQQHVS